MTEQRKIRFDEHLSGEGALTLAFATFTALLLGLLFVPLSFAQQQPHYSERFVSDEGKDNGLHRSDTPDEFDSAVDPLIASAGQENTSSTGEDAADNPIPFNGYYFGYYFRILAGQGENAPGGAKSYMVNGKMVNGFAFVAYPAKYRSSGVMTFIVNQDRTIYQKDLGVDTSKLAASMTQYNPDSTWRRVD
jgi:hypothetical protein